MGSVEMEFVGLINQCRVVMQRATTPSFGTDPSLRPCLYSTKRKLIGSVVLSCTPHVDTVLCVDDGSSDSSSRIARKLGAEVYHHRSNRGYGGALKTIFGTAQERRSQALVILDSDGQHEPSDIPHLLAPILSGEADVCHWFKIRRWRRCGKHARIPSPRDQGNHCCLKSIQ